VTRAHVDENGVRVNISDKYRVAAIVPCYNEATAIAKVVADLRESVPGMTVFVYDNASTDDTARVAATAGAVVRQEPRKGKGNVVRRAFGDIDADIYLLIDGDDTYDAAAAPSLIAKLVEGPYDHVLGVRRELEGAPSAYRPAHAVGNRVLNRIVARIFGDDVGDMLSGYRVFSRRFVKSFPAASREFEIETELTVHCLALRIPSASIEVDFKDRPPGSESKLRTYRDGTKILNIIVNLARHERPIAFYGLISALSAFISLMLAAPVLLGFARTGSVPRFPTFALSLFFVGVACLSMLAGLVMDGIRKARHEASRLRYLQNPAVDDVTFDERPLPDVPLMRRPHEARMQAS
jgi:glycosyltransferase involved in cell wall biosynthesis